MNNPKDFDIYARLLESQFKTLLSGLAVPRNALDPQATTSATAEPPPLTHEKLRETVNALRPAPPPVRLVENKYMTVDRVCWAGGGHAWQRADLSYWRAGAMLVMFILGVALPSPLTLLLSAALFVLRPRGWWEPLFRKRIVEQVPDLRLLQFEAPHPTAPPWAQGKKETWFVGHPVTIARARREIQDKRSRSIK